MQTPPARILLARAKTTHRKGDLATAARAFQDVLVRFPANRRARAGLAGLARPYPKARHVTQTDLETAAALIERGEYAAALVMAGTLLQVEADNPAVHEMVAVCHRKQGAPEKAVAAYDRALGGLDAPGLWAGKGAALIEMQRPGKAAAALRRAAALQPTNVQHLTLIARCEREMGQISRALATLRGARSLQPDDTGALVEEGRVLAAMNRTEEALSCLRKALRGGPGDVAALNEIGTLARATGDSAGATEAYTKALARAPHAAAIHHNLTLVRDYTVGDAHIDQMQGLLGDDTLSPGSRAYLHFALFNALDQIGEDGQAFAHLVRGNALRRDVLGYEINNDARFFDVLRKLTFGPLGAGEPGPIPVFIVGLPRSGTTLAERTLAAEAEVVPAGELPIVANACMPLLRTMISEGRSHVTSLELGALQKALRAGLADYAQGAGALIDKMPLNFRFLSLVAAALPEARFVHMARDPLAVGWSLYRTCFDLGGNGFAYDMRDIVAYQRMTGELMAQWHARLGARLIRLDYADLVHAPQDRAAALAAACGLPPRETPLANRAIRTASAGVVRDAVQTDRDNHWQRYADRLEPMRVALATGRG
jgi:tetratricopeptide (TPR) repeat protein